MKNNLLFLILFSNAFIAYGQSPTLAIRNQVLGIYSGTFQSYDNWPNDPILPAGVKMTALPNDSTAILFTDTINNISDTLYVVFTYSLPNMIPDTFLDNCCNHLAGEYNPSRDSIFLSYYPSDLDINPSGEFILNCVHHSFPTSFVVENPPSFNIQPNPASEKLYIDYPVGRFRTYSIFNISGQIIDFGILNKEINICNLPCGIYYFQLFGERTVVKPFIKG